jgi:hypothetical protein
MSRLTASCHLPSAPHLALAVLIVTLGGSLSGCVAAAEHARVMAERDSLRSTLDSVVNGAERLLALATRDLSAGHPEDAQKNAALLVQRHPASPLVTQANALQRAAAESITLRDARFARAAADSGRRDSLRLATAVQAMTRTRDSVANVTYYSATGIAQGRENTERLFLYIAHPDQSPPRLYVRIRHVGLEWLFISGYTIKADDRTFAIDASGRDEVVRETNDGGIMEWYTAPAIPHLAMLRAIVTSKSAILRCHGRTRNYDRAITADEKRWLRQTLDAYAVLASPLD